ncbi:MAG: GNAT family N-acetyltransferase [Bacteroidia bacterium]|nr:GNAT family N-acetyltransferase [Bacteroidia bacterium]
MLSILRSDSQNTDFLTLVAQLDADLSVRDGEEHAFYSQFNKVDMIRHALVAYQGDRAIGCGAIKALADDTTEVKRMFVLPELRGQGLAVQILEELEAWARELGYTYARLETGKKQPEAIRLYTKCGYQRIPNYGQYENVENSVCFEKKLS